jgi:hypothetical protein
MNPAWTIVLVVGTATVALKAAGPLVLGGHQLPAGALGATRLLAPALLAALVITQAVAGPDGLVLQPEFVTWLVRGRAGERSRAATVDDPVLCTQPKIGRWPLATA